MIALVVVAVGGQEREGGRGSELQGVEGGHGSLLVDSRGILLSQGVAWRPRQLPLRIEGYAGWFHTDDSSSRISTYEQNLLYAFQMPSLYGEGVRLALTVELELAKQLLLSAKLADTHYADRKRIGSDTEQIDGSHKTDLYALVRWKF